MPTQSRLAEVQAADAFLAQAKTLDGAPPIWGNGHWGGEHAASWIILDSDGAPAASLRFTAKKVDPAIASLSLIWRSRPLWRVDLESAGASHSNPPDAWTLGLPAVVGAVHAHPWSANRAHLLAQDQQWDLPYRCDTPLAIRRMGQAFLWLADEIRLTIGPEQRGFDGPTKAELFG